MLRKYQYGIWHCKLAHILRSNSTCWEGERRRRKKQTPRAELAISACGVGKRPSPHLSKRCFAKNNCVQSFSRQKARARQFTYTLQKDSKPATKHTCHYIYQSSGMNPNDRLRFSVLFFDVLHAKLRFISLPCELSRAFFHNSAQ